MILTFLKGIVIGVLISAPMGPVGLLCLRETIHSGRRDGLLTGIGATLSDLLYGIIAYWGVSLILDFLELYDALLRILGGMIIIIFSYFVYRQSNQEDKVSRPSRRLGKLHGVRKVMVAFFVTLSNPFIIFLFLPLYARFGFVQEAESIRGMSIAMSGLVVGCLLWWFFLTYVIRKATSRMGVRGLRIITRSVALILCIIGLLGLLTGIRHY